MPNTVSAGIGITGSIITYMAAKMLYGGLPGVQLTESLVVRGVHFTVLWVSLVLGDIDLTSVSKPRATAEPARW